MPKPFASQGTSGELWQQLRAMQQADDLVEGQLKRTGRTSCLFWALTVVLFLVMLFTMALGIAALTVLLVVGFVVLLVLAILSSVKGSRLKAQDLEDRRLALARRLLETVGQDADPQVPCSLQMDFDGYRKHGQKLEERKDPGYPPVYHFKYVDPWFTARGKLLDGNRFRVTVTQIVRRKEKRKAKYTKINERVRERIGLVLRLTPKAYPGWQSLQQSLQPGTLGDMSIDRVQVMDGLVRVVATTSLAWRYKGRAQSGSQHEDLLANGDRLAALFVWVYDQLRNCRPAGAT